jgi:tripartite-type tricarboxylate transporter receptor subunit TctC
MRPKLTTIAIALALVGSLLPSIAQAEQYPVRPVRILVGFAAGSGPDVLARTVATQLSNDLGQNFYIENRAGANGTIAIAVVVQSEPDGHTLLFSSSSITPTPYVNKNAAFDILRDLAPIATAGIGDGYLMLVHPSTPIHAVSEFIAFARSKRVLYGTPGVGNILHVVTELFRQKASIAMDHIPYKGASEVQTALLGKNIDVMFVTPPSVIAAVQDGKLRAIGYTGVKPLAEFPR